MHVLQFKHKLQVTPEQEQALEQITASMREHAQRLGRDVIQAERELDMAFRGGTASEAGIQALTGRIGGVNAELRAVHRVAHLKTRHLLSDDQRSAYNEVPRSGSKSPVAPLHRH